MLQEKPDLALSHGSRSQIVLSWLLGIPSIAIIDYEHAKMQMAGIGPKWLMVPEVISDRMLQMDPNHVMRYPGIKEDVYVPRFRPTQGIRKQLGLLEDDLVVTIRPPASDAHYHNTLSDDLFRDVVQFLSGKDKVRMVLLPRDKRQSASLHQDWPDLFKSRKVLIPERVVDGLNLMWFSDLVISAGGTMNREAAALGIPVYSIFKGKPAAVDRYLASIGKLVLLENATDVNKIKLVRREPTLNPTFGEHAALAAIVRNVTTVLEATCGASANAVKQ
jgi:uncharacterized protein